MTDAAGRLYGDGARKLQDAFDSRRLADRLTEIIVHERFDERQQEFIAQMSYFFLSTVDADGFPDVSYKGGQPGFVRCVDDQTLQFPSYDGNGMYRSLGNIADTGKVAILFIRQNDRATRMRIHGTATIITDPAIVGTFQGAEAVVEVSLGRTFPNCPRYVHDLATDEVSVYAPGPDHEPPEPEWKSSEEFADAMPRRSPE